jgi:hypothetical protein
VEPAVVELVLEEAEQQVVPVLPRARLGLGAGHHHHAHRGGGAAQQLRRELRVPPGQPVPAHRSVRQLRVVVERATPPVACRRGEGRGRNSAAGLLLVVGASTDFAATSRSTAVAAPDARRRRDTHTDARWRLLQAS